MSSETEKEVLVTETVDCPNEEPVGRCPDLKRLRAFKGWELWLIWLGSVLFLPLMLFFDYLILSRPDQYSSKVRWCFILGAIVSAGWTICLIVIVGTIM
ncbi:hypothetical protein GMRT_14553 [Giardia muris]|uniref:Uncharacterized protein n=1 Tax=Giardia muris TaxID=5742 RepID=A0A4Z1SSY7_GIAMU|nr:hypothetical protein GMRT_14553 [Giardia muris]|eukprot:TNJ29052.1 hypothetical protein GMRT_14553 [Giardia muris]